MRNYFDSPLLDKASFGWFPSFMIRWNLFFQRKKQAVLKIKQIRSSNRIGSLQEADQGRSLYGKSRGTKTLESRRRILG